METTETRHDLRRQDRLNCTQTVTVMWRDSRGEDKFANVPALDVSPHGLRLQLPEAVPYQATITLRAAKLGLHGRASVVHCSRKGTRFAVGVQFAGDLRWNPPAAQ
ncbi:MAG TPA: PilZ domain-containing protein [Bryobacteraceae bacterium]|nr:PilZ domain-containing protein [Bryobacteraceae bacterium]